MNNKELCNRIRNVAFEETNGFIDKRKESIIEKIVAHFELPEPKIFSEQYIDRNKSLNDINDFLESRASDEDRYWIINHMNTTTFSDAIMNLSPKFVEIYGQAEIAYKDGLCHICGNGFRKAAERLVYDFAVYMTGNEESVKYTIDNRGRKKEKSFFDRISEYLSSAPDAQDLANAARKLGNNFTHIVETSSDDYSMECLQAFVTLLASDISEIISPSDNIDNETRMAAKRILSN